MKDPIDRSGLAHKFWERKPMKKMTPGEWEALCDGCGKLATQRCSRCKNVWYCSRECQLKQWKGHKALCEIFS